MPETLIQVHYAAIQSLEISAEPVVDELMKRYRVSSNLSVAQWTITNSSFVMYITCVLTK